MPRNRWRYPVGLLLALVAGLILVLIAPAGAQSVADYGAVTPAAPETSPDLDAYKAITPVSATDIIHSATRGVDVFQQRMGRIIAALPTAIPQVHAALSAASPTGNPGYFVSILVFVAILIVIGRGGSQIFGAYVGRSVMVSIQKPVPVGMREKLPVLATRVGLTIVSVAITLFISGSLGTAFFANDTATRVTILVILGSYAACWLVDTVWRMFLSPYLPNYRVPRLSDSDAIRLYKWIAPSTFFAALTISLSLWLELLGVSPEVVAVFRIGLGFLTITILIIMLVRNRQAITGTILNGQPRAVAPWVSALSSVLWLPLMIGYLVFSWVASGFRIVMGLPGEGGLVSAFLILLVALIVYAVTVFVVERIFARNRLIAAMNREAAPEREPAPLLSDYEGGSGDMDGDGDEEGGSAGPRLHIVPPEEPTPSPDRPPPRRGMRSFEDLARRAASLFALGVAAFLLLRVWVGPQIFDEGTIWNLLQDIADTLFIGYILFHALRIWMDRKIEEEGGIETGGMPSDEGDSASAASRLATLLPLIRSFVLFCIVVAVSLIIAARLGVNVAPLFAGAGVVGLAIGFGSQALVRDILSGMFFLIDDAFRKGEYIDLGDVKGTVEKISLRSFQLRHHLGALNTVPFGEVKFLTNYSRDWVMMKLPLRLTYDTDVEKVRKVIKKLGQELLEHPIEGPKFLQPLKSQGVFMMEDSAMIVRVKFMTRPGDQWTTRRIVYTRIREVFAAEGIRFAHREVTVHLPGLVSGTGLSDAEAHAVGAAVRRTVDDADAEALMPRSDLAAAR